MYTTKQEVDEELPQEDELVEKRWGEKIFRTKARRRFLEYLRQNKSKHQQQNEYQNDEGDVVTI